MPESVLLLWMCFTALLLPQRNRLLLSVLSHVLGFVSDSKLYACFYSLCLLEISLGTRIRATLLLASNL